MDLLSKSGFAWVWAFLLSFAVFTTANTQEAQDPAPTYDDLVYPTPPSERLVPPNRVGPFLDLPRIFFPPNPRLKDDPSRTSEGPMREDPNAWDFGTAAPQLLRNWEGPTRNGDIGGNGFIPPDPIIAAGSSHVIVAVNDDVRIYNKWGTETGSFDANTFFGTSDFLFDPKVAYDPWRSRYLILFVRRNDATRESWWTLAVSKTSTPTANASDWWQYDFEDEAGTTRWVDYPQLGFGDNAVTLTGYLIRWASPDESYGKIKILNKDQIYNGLGAGAWNFTDLESDGSNDTHIMPAQMWSYGGVDYLMSTKRTGSDKLTVRRITWTGADWATRWSNPPSSSPEVRTIASYATPPDAALPNNATALDTIDCRLLSGTYNQGFFYASQPLALNWAGQGNRASVRVYRVKVNVNPSVVEIDQFGAAGWDYYYPAISHNGDGDAMIVYNRSSSTVAPQVRMTAWRATDATVEGGVLVRSSAAATYQVIDNQGRNRWGDYLGAALDPVDQKTVWMVGEHAITNTNWGTFVFEANYKTLTNLSASNATGAIGQTVNFTATLRRSDTNAVLSGQSVRFLVNGVLIGTANTNASGVATRSYTIPESLGVGSRTLRMEYNGDANFNASFINRTLTVNKANTTTTPDNKSGAFGQTITLTATLRRTTDNALLSGKSITFLVNGVSAGSANTNASGVASRNYTIPESLGTGAKTITAQFAGDTLHNASSNTATLTVNKANTAIVTANADATIGTQVALTGTLTRTTDGGSLSGRTLVFSVGGAQVGTANTNASGTATLNWNVTAGTLGNNTLNVAFAGDALYNASSQNAIFFRRANTTVTVQSVTGFLGQTVQLRAQLRRSHDGALIVGRPVEFRVNGTLIGTVNTDANGNAALNYLLTGRCDPRTIRVDFDGDGPLNPSFGTNTLTIKLMGDVNGDKIVNDDDLLLVLFAFGQSGGLEDLDGNGTVDDGDLLIVLFNFGNRC